MPGRNRSRRNPDYCGCRSIPKRSDLALALAVFIGADGKLIDAEDELRTLSSLTPHAHPC